MISTMGYLLVLFGMCIMGLGATIESWTMWLVIICGVFVLISGIKVVDLAHNYERLLERYNQLDEDYRKIKEDKQTKDNKEEKEEKEEPFANVSTEWFEVVPKNWTGC